MANGDERKVSISIIIRVGSLTQAQAQELEDKVRNVADDYNAEVQSTRGTERPPLRGG